MKKYIISAKSKSDFGRKKIILILIISCLLLPALGSAQSLENPIPSLEGMQPLEAIPIVISLLLQIGLGSLGALTLFMFIYGGFLMMTSAGKKDLYTKGKNAVVWATIGFTVVIFSYAILRFILTNIINAT